MFAIVRTGGKQYRVAAGDKIAVEKLAGEAGDAVTLDDVLLVSDGSTLPVQAQILEQKKGEKVIIFKKRRRHNYRRKNGHRQQLTILEILGIGADAPKQAAAAPAKAEAPAASEAAPAAEKATPKKAPAKKAAPKKAAADKKDEA
jgi:large subunit ribosomal protein L21